MSYDKNVYLALSFSSSIQGFMQKADAEKMLLQCASGTFLIRFSEGEPGSISVAWVTGEKCYLPFFFNLMFDHCYVLVHCCYKKVCV